MKHRLRSHRGVPAVPRRGVLTAWTIWAMLFSCLIVGWLFHVTWLSAAQSQAFRSASAAALAAGHSYLSDDMLRPWQQPFEFEGRETRCRLAAIRMADEYLRGTSFPPLSEDQIEILWKSDQRPVSDSAMLTPAGFRVVISHSSTAADAGFLASMRAAIQRPRHVAGVAALENSPVAFRPSAKSAVPMLPFAICNESEDGPDAGHWTRSVESGTGSDEFSWNPDLRKFENGPDGIPEISVMLRMADSELLPDSLAPLNFGGENSSASGTQLTRWILQGPELHDLQWIGRTEIAYPDSLTAIRMTAADCTECAAALRKKTGEPSVISLCRTRAGGGSDSKVQLTRPVAVRIAAVVDDAAGSVRVILQPCVIITSSAVTSHDRETAANRYVYSVRLVNSADDFERDHLQ